jgi:hypothetical protein
MKTRISLENPVKEKQVAATDEDGEPLEMKI